MTEPAKKKYRLSLEVDQTVRECLDDLRAKSGAASITEATRKAFAVYHLFVEHQAKGGQMVLRYPDGKEEVLRIV